MRLSARVERCGCPYKEDNMAEEDYKLIHLPLRERDQNERSPVTRRQKNCEQNRWDGIVLV